MGKLRHSKIIPGIYDRWSWVVSFTLPNALPFSEKGVLIVLDTRWTPEATGHGSTGKYLDPAWIRTLTVPESMTIQTEQFRLVSEMQVCRVV
jgi:hypothetical protein